MKHNLDNFLQALIEKTVDAYTQKILKELKFKKDKQNEDEELLTPPEACDFLKITDTTLWRWRKSGRIKVYGINGKRFYKKSELLDSLKPLKTESNE